METKKFIVKRSQWLRGTGSTSSYLRDEEGMQCCLGFVGQQCGIAEADLLNVCMPDKLKGATIRALYPQLPVAHRWTEFSSINDNVSISEEYREKLLQGLAQKCGFEFEFVD